MARFFMVIFSDLDRRDSFVCVFFVCVLVYVHQRRSTPQTTRSSTPPCSMVDACLLRMKDPFQLFSCRSFWFCQRFVAIHSKIPKFSLIIALPSYLNSSLTDVNQRSTVEIYSRCLHGRLLCLCTISLAPLPPLK